jgi:hypothetical protein
MTQPKRSSSSGPRKAPAPAVEETEGSGVIAAVRDAVASRAADGLGVVMLTRDRIQDALDDAVERGHMTREAANGLAEALVARGRQEWQDVFSDVEQLVGRVRDAGPIDGALRVVGAGSSFPISGYDDLTAAQITERLDGLTPAELRKVRDYERRHGNRKSVLAAVERKLK